MGKFDSMDAGEFKNGYRLEGYTRVTTMSNGGSKFLLYVHPSFQGKEWCDWVYVHLRKLLLLDIRLKITIQKKSLVLLQ